LRSSERAVGSPLPGEAGRRSRQDEGQVTMRAAPGRVVAVLLLGSAGVLALAGGLVRAQVVASQQSFPRTADGKPDLSGIWQTISTANWDLEGHEARPSPVLALGAVGAVPPGLGVVEGGRIPYQGWAAAKKQENARNWLTLDPEIKCFLPGVPRATSRTRPQSKTRRSLRGPGRSACRCIVSLTRTRSSWSSSAWS